MNRILTHDGVELGYITLVGREYVATRRGDGVAVRRAYESYDAAVAWLIGSYARDLEGDAGRLASYPDPIEEE